MRRQRCRAENQPCHATKACRKINTSIIKCQGGGSNLPWKPSPGIVVRSRRSAGSGQGELNPAGCAQSLEVGLIQAILAPAPAAAPPSAGAPPQPAGRWGVGNCGDWVQAQHTIPFGPKPIPSWPITDCHAESGPQVDVGRA